MEGIVLLGVEHLKQCRCRVAVMRVLRHLVYLVENEDGVRRTGFLYALDDTSGHCADIGAAVAANLCLVVQSAQRYTYILTLHGGGNRLA